MGFLRRDYGAAGLFQLAHTGQLTGVQAVVALTVMTLFVPCVANFLMMVRERGLKTGLAIVAVITPVADVSPERGSIMSSTRLTFTSDGGRPLSSLVGRRAGARRRMSLRPNGGRADRLLALGVTPGARRHHAADISGRRVFVRSDGARGRARRCDAIIVGPLEARS